MTSPGVEIGAFQAPGLKVFRLCDNFNLVTDDPPKSYDSEPVTERVMCELMLCRRWSDRPDDRLQGTGSCK